ncbi:flavin reductase family protein [Rhodococcus sp. CH91]|uniref:flavin reductase family protein n=1 Tax=Rhodococcus sp. CH91 TaxID=2910256 RepID=UPI001F4AA4D1|nr:flavin reductase family protein [Rhodococcus sp. CH91]
MPEATALDLPRVEPIDPQHMRHVLGSYPTGVAIITGRAADGSPLGMVVGTFNSVSMDPPLVSFMPMKSSYTFSALRESRTFCVNIMAADQEGVCGAFMRRENKFEGVDWRESPTGSPILEGTTAWIECEWSDVIDAGDHYFVLGAVRELAAERNCLPLLFFQRGYGRFTPGSLMASDYRSLAAAIRTAECGRQEMELLANELGMEVSLLAPLGDEFAFVATANAEGPSHSTMPGTRLPFVPPLGSLMVDHPGAPSRQDWLDRAPHTSREVREVAEIQLRRVQERGWSVTLSGEVNSRTLDELVDAFSAPARTPENEQRLIDALQRMAACHEPADIDPTAIYSPLQLSVPVRNPEGNVVMVLRLSGLPENTSGTEILDFIHRIRQSSTAIGLALPHAVR